MSETMMKRFLILSVLAGFLWTASPVGGQTPFPSTFPSGPPPTFPPARSGPPAYAPVPVKPVPPPPSTQVAPREPAAINPWTGELYPGTYGGVINPKTGVVLPRSDGGYYNPQTGEFIPRR